MEPQIVNIHKFYSFQSQEFYDFVVLFYFYVEFFKVIEVDNVRSNKNNGKDVHYLNIKKSLLCFKIIYLLQSCVFIEKITKNQVKGNMSMRKIT